MPATQSVRTRHFPDLADIFFLAKAWILARHHVWSTIDWLANYPSHFDTVSLPHHPDPFELSITPAGIIIFFPTFDQILRI